MKAHVREEFYTREKAVYLRLREHSVTQVEGFAVPRLIAFGDELWVRWYRSEYDFARPIASSYRLNMLDTALLRENYSGIVNLRLRVGDRDFDLSRIGPGYVVFRRPVELPPCRGTVIVKIDDRQHDWPVDLCNGATLATSTATAIDDRNGSGEPFSG